MLVSLCKNKIFSTNFVLTYTMQSLIQYIVTDVYQIHTYNISMLLTAGRYIMNLRSERVGPCSSTSRNIVPETKFAC